MWELNNRESGRVEFICEHGVGHYPVWADCTVHGCDGCCRQSSFPGKEPSPGDLALCGAGTLGLITMSGKQAVTYPDGNQAMAWVGIHMTDAITEKGAEWSTRNPVIMGSLIEMLDLNQTLKNYIQGRQIQGAPMRWKR